MASVRYAAHAENDMLDAWLYMAEDNPSAAHKLLDQPKMGRMRNELAAGLRSWPTTTPYILFDFESADGIVIARVLHHARDAPGLSDWSDR